MGAWGKGPFDNDRALDRLGDLARQAGQTWNDEEEAFIGSPNASRVQERIGEWLTQVAIGDQVDDLDATLAYAALGLLAAALAEPEELTATIAGDDNPFSGGEPFSSLLSRASADGLLARADVALDAVFDPKGVWHAMWFDSEGLSEWRVALARLLRRRPHPEQDR